MTTRTLDAGFLNTVANDPDVRPWLGGEGALDLSEIVGNPFNVAWQFEGGGFVMVYLGHGIYDVHSLVRRDGRGTEAMRAMRAGLTYMFTRTDCVELVTRVPSGNVAAKTMCHVAGFTERFTRKQAWPTIGGPQSVTVHGLTLDAWMMAAKECRDAGELFHQELTAGAEARGCTLPPHSDDGPAHDHAAGAAYLMCLAGNARKAERTYNLWAAVAGYDPMRVESDQPLIIDVGYGISVEHDAGRMNVLRVPFVTPKETVCH